MFKPLKSDRKLNSDPIGPIYVSVGIRKCSIMAGEGSSTISMHGYPGMDIHAWMSGRISGRMSGRMPAGCRPDAGRMPAGCRPDAGRMLARCWPDAGWMPAGCPAGCRLDAGEMPAGCPARYLLEYSSIFWGGHIIHGCSSDFMPRTSPEHPRIDP